MLAKKPAPLALDNEPSNHPNPRLFDSMKRKRTHEPCELVPFPVKRRVHYLRNIDIEAYKRFEDSIEKGEAYFRSLIDRHKQRLEQLGVAPHRIAADVKAFEDHFFSSDDAAA